MKKTLIIIGIFIVIIAVFTTGVYFGHTLTKVETYSVRLTKDIYLNKPTYLSEGNLSLKVFGRIKKGSIGEAVVDVPPIKGGKYNRINFPLYLDSNSFERID
ncbi:MAG: hypothetical protein WCY05_03665 [Candidatus Omnitrophota bacterium]